MKQSNTIKRVGLVLSVLLLFLFSISICSANYDFISFGNTGTRNNVPGFSNLLFGSNFIEGNIDFTSNIISESIEYFPIITDLNNDGENEIYIFKDDKITWYDNEGNIIQEFFLDNDMCGHPVTAITRTTKVLVLMTDTTLGKEIKVLKNDGELEILQTDGFVTSSDYNCNGYGGYNNVNNMQDMVYFIRDDNEVLHYNVTSDSSDIYTGSPISSTYATCPSSVLGGCGTFGLRTDNDFPILYWSTASNQIISYRPDLNVWDYEIFPTSYSRQNTYTNFVKLGTSYTPYVIVNHYEVGSSVKEISVYDRDLNLKFNANYNSDTSSKNMPVVCDYDKDGENEIIFYNISNIVIINSLMQREGLYSVSTNSDWFSYMACGEYNNSDDYMELITPNGKIFKINNVTNTTDNIFNITTGITDGMVYPVQIVSKTDFSKDLFFADQNTMIYSISSGTASICGNEVCESGETVFNCFIDCGTAETTPNVNSSVGSFGNLQECQEDSDCYGDLVCSQNLCVGLIGGQNCTYDFECKSGDCNEFGFCTQQDNVNKIQEIVYIFGFRSTKALIFLALIILFVGTMIGAGLGLSQSVAGSVFGGVLGLITSAMFVILVMGWLGIWIIFITVLVAIIGLILALMFGGSSS